MAVSISTECIVCGGGTGQQHPCTCAANRQQQETLKAQEPVAWVDPSMLAWGDNFVAYQGHTRYTMPLFASQVLPAPAQKKPELTSAALNTIGEMLTKEMDIAVANGANSISMPDEYVEIAAWLAAAQKEAP